MVNASSALLPPRLIKTLTVMLGAIVPMVVVSLRVVAVAASTLVIALAFAAVLSRVVTP
jgi:hypothetical protein